MNADIALILAQDGIVNGAIYALLALSLVLVFAVTRVVLIPLGELVAFGALTSASLQAGRLPGSVFLLGGLGVAAFAAGRLRDRGEPLAALAASTLGLPAGVILLAVALRHQALAPWQAALVTLAIVTPMAGYVYRIAFQPLADASVLVLLIAAIGVHWALSGLGLLFFGPEGSRAAGFSGAVFHLGNQTVAAQALFVVGLAASAMLGLFLLSGFTLPGKALRAAAVNALGARLCGISTVAAGRAAFLLAGGIATLSGVLVVPVATVYYDSGFLIGLKGFVAAIVGGMASFPVAAIAALLLGVGESFVSFWYSDFKDVIVFLSVIPVLLIRTLAARGEDGE